MKFFKLLFTVVIALLLCFFDSNAQKTTDTRKDLSAEIGFTYLNFDFHRFVDKQFAFGGYFQMEKTLDQYFGIYCSYNFNLYSPDSYVLTSDEGYNLGRFKTDVYFHSLHFGGNWYIRSNDIANTFTPFIGASVRVTYSYDKTAPTGLSKHEVSSADALNFAFAPSFGLNIPVSKSLCLRLRGDYVYSLFDIELEERLKRNFKHYTVNLGLKYNF